MAENPAERISENLRKTLSDWGGVFFVYNFFEQP